MQGLFEIFDSLKARFADDEIVTKSIEREVRQANEWISEHTAEESERAPRKLENVEPLQQKPKGGRSIFDDIDAGEDPDN